MKIQKYFLLSLLITVIVNNSAHAQGPGEPYNPETANGAKYIHSTGHRLLWQNPDSTVFNIIYFSEDSNLVAQLDTSVILYDGTPSTVYHTIYLTTVEPLDWSRNYYWRVVEFYNFGSMEGPIWSFQTMENPICEYEVFFDDFESGLNNWIVTNNGGTCVWEVFYPPYPNMYTLPFTSSGGVLAADAGECGSGTTTLSTITLTTPLGNGQYYKILEFDNDWNAIDAEDAAYVEVSADGGVTWEIVWSKVGIDWRDTHEVILIGYYVEILVRFRSVQPGWDWWWAIDNVRLVQDCPLTQFYPPHNLLLNTISEPTPKVELSWSKLGPFGSGFLIERKIGSPTDSTTYSTIGQVDYSVTNFIDSTVVKNQTYTYRIHGIPYLDTGPSNEATAYIPKVIPVELTSFTASVSGNDVHLKWSIATELNNSGFEIQKLYPPLNPLPGGEQKRWVKIGFVPGYGTITERQNYTFVDESVSSGKYQYRLKQIDYDGTFEYSDIVEVEVGLPTEFSLEQNYPNPFNPTTKIKFTIPLVETGHATPVQLKVYDVLGNEIATLVNEEKHAGNYEVEFSVGQNSILSLSSGIYFYQLKAGSYIQTKNGVQLL